MSTKRQGLTITKATAAAVAKADRRRRRRQPAAVPPPIRGGKKTRKTDTRGNVTRATFIELPEADWALLREVALHRAEPGQRPSMKSVLISIMATVRSSLESELQG